MSSESAASRSATRDQSEPSFGTTSREALAARMASAYARLGANVGHTMSRLLVTRETFELTRSSSVCLPIGSNNKELGGAGSPTTGSATRYGGIASSNTGKIAIGRLGADSHRCIISRDAGRTDCFDD